MFLLSEHVLCSLIKTPQLLRTKRRFWLPVENQLLPFRGFHVFFLTTSPPRLLFDHVIWSCWSPGLAEKRAPSTWSWCYFWASRKKRPQERSHNLFCFFWPLQLFTSPRTSLVDLKAQNPEDESPWISFLYHSTSASTIFYNLLSDEL